MNDERDLITTRPRISERSTSAWQGVISGFPMANMLSDYNYRVGIATASNFAAITLLRRCHKVSWDQIPEERGI